MKRLSHIRLAPLLCLLFLLPVHATETRIIESSLRDQYFLDSLKKHGENTNFDCCTPIVHRVGIHPHIINDCGLLVTGYIERKVPKNIVVPRALHGLLVTYLAGDLDENHFDKTCFVHNDTGAFIGWIPYANKNEGVYKFRAFHICNCRYSYCVTSRNLLACKKFKTPYGKSGRDKDGYGRGGFNLFGKDLLGRRKDYCHGYSYDSEWMIVRRMMAAKTLVPFYIGS